MQADPLCALLAKCDDHLKPQKMSYGKRSHALWAIRLSWPANRWYNSTTSGATTEINACTCRIRTIKIVLDAKDEIRKGNDDGK